jgi:hypothetical protein
MFGRFVHMDDEDGALEAIAELNGHDLHGRKMKVRYLFHAPIKNAAGILI